MQDEFNTPPLAPEETQARAAEFNQAADQNLLYSQMLEEQKQEEVAAAAPQEPEPSFLSETGAALAGGAAEAVESVGSFAELTGDTLKTGFNYLFGRPVDDTQNPFSDDYEAGDASWLDIPDTWVPENKTGLGKLARGLVEFGLLTAATGGVGGATFGGARLGVRGLAAARAAGVGAKGVRTIKFVQKGAKIAGEGAIADLISSSSETANIANLVEENAPWMAPWVAEALAIDPEDNPWLARIKTVASGAGINLVGHGIASYAKGAWAAHRARQAGKSVDEANEIGNQVMKDEMDNATRLDEEAAEEMSKDRFSRGYGVDDGDFRDNYIRTYLDADEYKAYKTPEEDPVPLLREQVANLEAQAEEARAAKNTTEVRRINKVKREIEGIIKEAESKEKVNYEAIADQRGAEAGDVFDFDKGMSTNQATENMGRVSDFSVNYAKYDSSERATTRPEPEPGKRALRQGVKDMKQGGDGRSYEPMYSETAINAMSRGDKNLRQYIDEVAEDISNAAFKELDNALSAKDVKTLIVKQAADLHDIIEGGGDVAANFKKYIEESPNKRIYENDGTKIVVGSPALKAALQLSIHSLAKQAQMIATGALTISKDLSINRQAEMVFDAMKVAVTEHKKIGYMAGLELRLQQGQILPKALKNQTEAQLAKVELEMQEFRNALMDLARRGEQQQLEDLLEIFALSGHKVRTMTQVTEFIRAKIFGGQMNGVKIQGRWRQELQSAFYNSILSAPLTPIKAIAGTNLVGILRPLQAYVGAGLRGNHKEMAIAAAQIDALGQAFAEGFQMFKYNWDLGLNRKSMSYDGRFDLSADLGEWQAMRPYIDSYGSKTDQFAYNALDTIVKFNTSPWVKYSQNAMGAGDALARTIIGRLEMRGRAARKAIDDGVDLTKATDFAKKYEDNFREEIFKKNGDGFWVVSDKAAKMAGDEAALNRPLEGVFQAAEGIQRIPMMRAFFPFVRTGINAIDLTFDHTPLAIFKSKYDDIMNGKNLEKYGIRPEDLPQAQALMEGRIFMGTSIMSMAAIAALAGNLTGDYPYDKESRKNWQMAGIEPYAFKFGNVYISYKNLEPFNTLFSMTANVVQNADVLGETVVTNWMQKLSFMTAAVLVDKSMLSGVEDLARLMNPETSEDLLTKTGARYIRSHLPYAGLLGQLGDVLDANQKEAQKLSEMIIKRDAFVKSTLPPKYDILSKDRTGKELIIGPENTLLRLINSMSPIPITVSEGDPIKEKLVEMRFNLPQTLSTYKGVPLNAYEMSEMQKYLSMGSLRRRLESVMGSKAWQREFEAFKKGGFNKDMGDDLADQSWYQDVHRQFRKAKDEALNMMRANNPELVKKLEDRQVRKNLGRSGSYERLQEWSQRTGI